MATRTVDETLPALGDAPAVAVYAQLPDPCRRGVVVLHEIFGRQPEIDRVVARFAAAGYAAVAPDLFAAPERIPGGFKPLDFVAASRPLCISRAVRDLGRGEGPSFARIRRARAWLCEQSGLEPAAVGLIGFCFGGGFALAAGAGFGAVSTNYGPVPTTGAMTGIGPVIGCYGGNDFAFRSAPRQLRDRLRPLGIEPEIHVVDGAGHSFLTDGHHPIGRALSWPLMRIGFRGELAEQGWAHILAFFDRQLDRRLAP